MNFKIQSLWLHKGLLLKSAFIVFFIYTVSIWSLPAELRLRTRLLQPVKAVGQFLGLAQAFHTFSPNPHSSNERVFAIVTYNDGSAMEWRFRNCEDAKTYSERLFAYRYRIYWQHSLRQNKELWPDFARYVARQSNIYAGKQPSSVRLFRSTQPIAHLDAGTGRIAEAPPAVISSFYNVNLTVGDPKR